MNCAGALYSFGYSAYRAPLMAYTPISPSDLKSYAEMGTCMIRLIFPARLINPAVYDTCQKIRA